MDLSPCHRLQQVIHSVLACRMMLRLRDYGRRTMRGNGFADCTGLSMDNDDTVAVDGPLNFPHGRSFGGDIGCSAYTGRDVE